MNRIYLQIGQGKHLLTDGIVINSFSKYLPSDDTLLLNKFMCEMQHLHQEVRKLRAEILRCISIISESKGIHPILSPNFPINEKIGLLNFESSNNFAF